MMQHVSNDHITHEENATHLQQTNLVKSFTLSKNPHDIEDDIHSESSQKSSDLPNVTQFLCNTVDNGLQKSDDETVVTTSNFSRLHSNQKLATNNASTETFSSNQDTPLSHNVLVNQDIPLTEEFSETKDINVQVRYLLGKLNHEEEKLNHVLRLNEELQKHCKNLQNNIDTRDEKLGISHKVPKNIEDSCKNEKNVDLYRKELQSRSEELAETKVLLAALCEDKEKTERLNQDHIKFLQCYHPSLIKEFNSWRERQHFNDSESLANQRLATKIGGKKKKNLFKMLQNKAMNNYMFFSAV
ncbi:myosin-3-like isoform X2 [Hylaeus volcanicus]|uniref:myosin-3-like isoform X2 n=1 Tax=Hylaeus volcanicus TaxID=313075 RepID=UPI0023B81451|nr:myosin-3-like isoform X2 [Hylaeus volcanicus]